MKEIKFRPLRRNKKTGKVIVASYMQWRNIRSSDHTKFELSIDEGYKLFPDSEFVYNHKGEQLFFFPYNPATIPILNYTSVEQIFDLEKIQEQEMYGIYWGDGSYITFSAKGLDVDGVPTFSHYTADSIAMNYKDVSIFEPLTVGMVRLWFGWFLYQLQNSNLKYVK